MKEIYEQIGRLVIEKEALVHRVQYIDKELLNLKVQLNKAHNDSAQIQRQSGEVDTHNPELEGRM